MYKCTICHILRDLTFFTFKLDRILKMIAGFKKTKVGPKKFQILIKIKKHVLVILKMSEFWVSF